MACRREPRHDNAQGATGTVLDELACPACRAFELLVLIGKSDPMRARWVNRRLPAFDPHAVLTERGAQ